jgi:hypothetical protein
LPPGKAEMATGLVPTGIVATVVAFKVWLDVVDVVVEPLVVAPADVVGVRLALDEDVLALADVVGVIAAVVDDEPVVVGVKLLLDVPVPADVVGVIAAVVEDEPVVVVGVKLALVEPEVEPAADEVDAPAALDEAAGVAAPVVVVEVVEVVELLRLPGLMTLI